jgi:Tfp pilus assembly protein PilN
MADIDMIPREYRDGVRVRRTVRLTGIALAVVVLAAAGSFSALRWRAAALERTAQALQDEAAQAQATAARTAALQAGQVRRQHDEAVLHALRRAGELDALAQGLDASLTDQVWLTELHVERDVQAASAAQPAKAPAAAPLQGVEEFTAPGDAQAWRLASTVEFTGQAANYGAVTAFLGALGRQPGIAGLRLVGSTASGDGQTIDFRATGMLARKDKETGAGQ